MILINFAYPLTPDQTASIESLLSQTIERVISISVDLDNDLPFRDQVEHLLNDHGLPLEDLMTLPVLVILPSHSYIAALVLAALQGRMGRFPAVIRFKPITDSLPIAYEVAEIVDLQRLRDEIRQQRSKPR